MMEYLVRFDFLIFLTGGMRNDNKFKLHFIAFLLISLTIFLSYSTLHAQTPITCGQTTPGSISVIGEKDDYTFSASPGAVVTIRLVVTSGAMTPYLELYDQTMTKIAYNYSSSGNYTYIDKALTPGGTYTIRVYDYGNDSTGNYSLTYLNLTTACNAATLNCGQTAPYSLSAVGEVDFYKFTANPNDGALITVVRTSGDMNPYIELYDSTGAMIASNNSYSGNYASINKSLTLGGTYTVVVYDYNNNGTGNYAIRYQNTTTACNATPITCGQTTAGSLSTAVEQDFYTFTATANDKVTIRLVRTSGTMDPYLELYDTTGTRIASDYTSSGNSATINSTLTAGGTYIIVVYDYNNDETGDYNLTWQKLNPPCNATAITCGQTTPVSLSAAGERDFYSFTVTAGDAVTIRLIKTLGTFQPKLVLYDSAGTSIASSYNYSGNDVVLDRSLSPGGTYILEVSDYGDDATGSYNLTWQKLNYPCSATTINCGQTLSGSLSSIGKQDFYTFSANAGDAVTIRVPRTSGNINPYVELYDSTGIRIAYGNAYSGNYINLDKALSSGGTYTIIVSDYNNDATGNYKITWQRLNNPCNATTITCGQTIPGSISALGKQDIYSFTDTAGSNIVLTLTKTSGGFDPSLELYNSSGTRIAYQYTSSGSSVTINQTLSAGDTYIIFVSDYGNDETGNYTLKFQKNNNSCTEVVLNAPNGGEIIDAGSTFKIMWTPKSTVGITSQEIRLSTDGGATFPTVIATGLAGSVQSFNWSVSSGLKTTQGRIRVNITDTTGISVYDNSDSDFIILQGVPKVSRTYEYDKLNRLTKIINEDGSQINYTYDAVGNRITLFRY